MKKTALTFVAVAFGMGVAFAQTTPQAEEKPAASQEQSITVDRLSNKPEEGRLALNAEELPAVLQTRLQSDEFKSLIILSVTEVKPEAGALPRAAQYEVAFANEAAATTPALLVFFDEKGVETSRQDAAAPKTEE